MDTLANFRDRIAAAQAGAKPLRLRGAGTKDFYGEVLFGDVLDTRPHRGIVSYEPSELVVTARCGTPLSEVESALAAERQFLAFEPPRFGADPTIGGVVAAGLSGPRRASAGAVRDFVLGASLLGAGGEELHFGGQVMKNVAGFDVSRLLCGSLGFLGLITQVSLKVMPLPRAELTLQLDCDARDALARFDQWRALPLPISAACWQAGALRVRLSGARSAVRAACAVIGGASIADAEAADGWQALRDQSQPFFGRAVDETRSLWRLSLPATAPFDLGLAAPAPDDLLIEWAGALRWLYCAAAAEPIRTAAAKAGGTAMRWRGPRDGPMFHPLAPATLALHRRLKQAFDPLALFNRGRLLEAA